MTEAELVERAPALIQAARAAAASGEISEDRANAVVGQLHCLRGEWRAAAEALRAVRNRTREQTMFLSIAESRLRGADARDAAASAVAAGLDGGAICYEHVLQSRAPELPAAQLRARDWPLSQRLLRAGDFQAAAKAANAEALPGALPTAKAQALRLRDRTLPCWDGAAVGRLILPLHFGLGDVVLYARYLPALTRMAEHVTVACPAPIRNLLAAAFDDAEVLAFADAVDAVQRADAFARPESLPHYTGAGYGRAAWLRLQRPSASSTVRRIGICWRGTPKNGHDRLRSVPVAELEQLFAVPGAEWHSIQRGEAVSEIPAGVVDRSGDLGTIEGAARVVGEMDLVVSCDTFAANVAGSIGMPTWVMVEHDNDFRWGERGSTSPWYPAARIFRRRPDERNWRPTVQRVAEALG